VDQVKLLKSDNIVDSQAKNLTDLGVEATSMDAIVPAYVEHYRAGGRFTVRKRNK